MTSAARPVPPPVGLLAPSTAVQDVDTPRTEEQWPICSARAADRLHHHERHFQRSATDDRSESLSRADGCGIYDETLARLPDAQQHLQSCPEIAKGGLLPEGESQTAARRPPDADVHCAQAPFLRNASTLYKRAETAVARSHQVVNGIPHIPRVIALRTMADESPSQDYPPSLSVELDPKRRSSRCEISSRRRT